MVNCIFLNINDTLVVFFFLFLGLVKLVKLELNTIVEEEAGIRL